MIDFKKLKISDFARLLDDGKITSVSLCEYFLNRIDVLDKKLNAYIYINRNDVIEQAKQSDRRRKEDKILSKYDGIPISIKDIITYKDHLCTCGSKILSNYIASFDATVVRRFKDSGIIILGKNNMDEFGIGSCGTLSSYGKVANPWNIEKIIGGSSSGSAAAVSSFETIASLGTDTGGSVRFPAALGGIVGFRPTYGTISRYGVVSHSSFLDQIGILSRCVDDVSVIFDIISGEDTKDGTSISNEYLNKKYLEYGTLSDKKDLKDIKIGIIKEFDNLDGLDIDVKKTYCNAIDIMKESNAEIIEISVPHVMYSSAAYYVLSSVDITTNLARFDGVRYGVKPNEYTNINDFYSKVRGMNFGREVLKRILLGSYILYNKYDTYLRAKKLCLLLAKELKDVFKKCDVILTPISSQFPAKLDGNLDIFPGYLDDVFATMVNMSGNCGITLPVEINEKYNLPMGIQLVGPFLSDKKLLSISKIFENNRKIKEIICTI